MSYSIYFLILSLLFFACQIQGSSSEHQENFTFPYNLRQPDKVLKLNKSLQEISGITYYGQNQIAALQDEKGKIYILSLAEGEIQQEIKFAKDGDFEGITYDGKKLIALRSDGKIYQFRPNEQALKRQEWKTGLSQKQDCEGIAWQAQNGLLWIAAKGKPKEALANKKDKAFYTFSPQNEDLQLGLTISQPALESQFDAQDDFEPSGLAFAPEGDLVYTISSSGKALIVMNLEGEYLYYQNLNRDIFPQPEGICFSPEGQLIIASEGRDKKARLLIFNPSKK